MEKPICSYRGCNEPVNSPHDDTLCVFHAPVEKKGITVGEFNKLIFEKIKEITEHNQKITENKETEDYYFLGYIFPGYIDFSKTVFLADVYFSRAQFSELAYFSEAQFSGYANFAETQFSGFVDFSKTHFSEKTSFFSAKFSGDGDFTEAHFLRNADFIETKFLGNADFYKTKFSGRVNFNKTLFSEEAIFFEAQFSDYTNFSEAQFLAYADFSEAQFSGNANFNRSRFDGKGLFVEIKIKKSISYEDITLGEKARFYFQRTKSIAEEGHTAAITFEDVRFNPFAVYFENIGNTVDKKKEFKNTKALLIFRYCQLKDVYFTNNDMSLFSFYKSSFDEARFISSKWSEEKDRILFIPFKRKNIIPEEKFLSDSTDKEKFKVEDLNGYEDIASLYRQMKTALDNTKDYQQASWFYFNEFEMKRRALEEEIENSLPKWRVFRWRPLLWFYRQLKKIFSRYIFYFFYKVFAGFGEKPLWSFYWFLLGLLGFTTLNYYIGLKKGFSLPGGTINYVDASFWDSLIFTLYRIIPANYLPFKQMFDIPHGFWGMLVPFLNTAVLIIFIAFIAIGLKRHFRRF